MEIKVGDRVTMSSAWCRSTGHIFRVSPASWAGRVVDLETDRGRSNLATVAWDHGETKQCLAVNLWPIDKLHLEPA